MGLCVGTGCMNEGMLVLCMHAGICRVYVRNINAYMGGAFINANQTPKDVSINERKLQTHKAVKVHERAIRTPACVAHILRNPITDVNIFSYQIR